MLNDLQQIIVTNNNDFDEIYNYWWRTRDFLKIFYLQ
jgi:hypothetical protein